MKTKSKTLITHRQLAVKSQANWHRILALVAAGELVPSERVGNRMFFVDADIEIVQRATRAPAEVGL